MTTFSSSASCDSISSNFPRGDTITLTYIEIKRGPCKNRRATLGARSMYHWPKCLSVSTLGCDQVELLAKKYCKTKYVIGSLGHVKL